MWEKQYLVAIQADPSMGQGDQTDAGTKPLGIDILQVKYQILSNFMRSVSSLAQNEDFLDVDKNNKYRAGLFYLNQQLKIREDLDMEKQKYLEKKDKNHGLFCKIKRGLKDDHHHHHNSD